MTLVQPVHPPDTPRAPAGATPEARRQAARDFEGQVLAALLQPLFAGLDTKGPFGGGSAEAQWRPLLVDEIARSVARAGGLGIAAAVARELDGGQRR